MQKSSAQRIKEYEAVRALIFNSKQTHTVTHTRTGAHKLAAQNTRKKISAYSGRRGFALSPLSLFSLFSVCMLSVFIDQCLPPARYLSVLFHKITIKKKRQRRRRHGTRFKKCSEPRTRKAWI